MQGDQCLDSPCYQTKVAAHIQRELAVRPSLTQIETGWRNPKQQAPGALVQGQYIELPDAPTMENPDAEPDTEYPTTKTAIIVYGKGIGTLRTICANKNCAIHDPRNAARVTAPATAEPEAFQEPDEEETPEEQQQREERQRAYEAEEERKAEEKRQEFQAQEEAYQA